MTRPSQEQTESAKIIALRYISALSFVVAVGVAAWWVTKDEDTSLVDPAEEEPKEIMWLYIQLLGWSSALLFVRVP